MMGSFGISTNNFIDLLAYQPVCIAGDDLPRPIINDMEDLFHTVFNTKPQRHKGKLIILNFSLCLHVFVFNEELPYLLTIIESLI